MNIDEILLLLNTEKFGPQIPQSGFSSLVQAGYLSGEGKITAKGLTFNTMVLQTPEPVAQTIWADPRQQPLPTPPAKSKPIPTKYEFNGVEFTRHDRGNKYPANVGHGIQVIVQFSDDALNTGYADDFNWERIIGYFIPLKIPNDYTIIAGVGDPSNVTPSTVQGEHISVIYRDGTISAGIANCDTPAWNWAGTNKFSGRDVIAYKLVGKAK